jgi:hypothetical protein
MQCPYCGEELEWEDYFGRLAAHQDGYVAGHIYRCPNGLEQDGSCESELFHVAGSFYTYTGLEDQLHEGYPC